MLSPRGDFVLLSLSIPVNSCHNKASFLLKFSGLTKVPTSKEDILGSTSRPGWAQKSRKWQKVSTAVSTVGVLKQSVSAVLLHDITYTCDIVYC